jgi:hypothetical protein
MADYCCKQSRNRQGVRTYTFCSLGVFFYRSYSHSRSVSPLACTAEAASRPT